MNRQQPQPALINSFDDLGSQFGVYLDAEQQRQHICRAKDGSAHNRPHDGPWTHSIRSPRLLCKLCWPAAPVTAQRRNNSVSIGTILAAEKLPGHSEFPVAVAPARSIVEMRVLVSRQVVRPKPPKLAVLTRSSRLHASRHSCCLQDAAQLN